MAEKVHNTVSGVVTRHILQSFGSLCRKLQLLDHKQSIDIPTVALEDELGRFRVWAGNIGAVQRGHGSLEYRLREAPLVLESVLKLLDELSNSLSSRALNHTVVKNNLIVCS